MVKLKTRIKSSTLIEVIIAMLIILVCLFIAFNVYIKTNASANFLLKMQAHLLTEEIFTNTKSKMKYIDEQFEYDNLIINKMVKPYTDNEKLKIIEIVAMTRKDRLLFKKKEVIRVL